MQKLGKKTLSRQRSRFKVGEWLPKVDNNLTTHHVRCHAKSFTITDLCTDQELRSEQQLSLTTDPS